MKFRKETMNRQTINTVQLANSECSEPANVRTFYFKSEGIWLINIGLILFGGLLSFKEFVTGNYGLSIGILSFVIFWALIRLFFKARSPQYIKLYFDADEIAIREYFPKTQLKILSVKELKEVKLYVPASRFPMAIVELIFNSKVNKKILFELDNTNSGFFSLLRVVPPDAVTDFVNTLNLHIHKGNK